MVEYERICGLLESFNLYNCKTDQKICEYLLESEYKWENKVNTVLNLQDVMGE
jgi:hypothetical protein